MLVVFWMACTKPVSPIYDESFWEPGRKFLELVFQEKNVFASFVDDHYGGGLPASQCRNDFLKIIYFVFLLHSSLPFHLIVV